VAKGALLPHRAIIANGTARAVADALTWRDRVLIILPMAFTGGASSYLRESLVTGATAVVAAAFDPPRVLELLEQERITICSAVPVIWETLLTLPQLDKADLSALRACIGAGATTPVEVIRAWQARGVGMRQGYGQTEFAGGYATLLYEDEAEHKAGFVGRPIMHHELRIADEHDRDVPAGQPGQILLRGPSVMAGYHDNPEASAEALAGGWLHTGDIGVLDEDGYLAIVDRKKDMLIYKGYNVYPRQLEELLYAQAGVSAAAVVGKLDPDVGELPVAFVVGADLDREKLRDTVNDQLLPYQKIREVHLVESLPVSAAGKVLKRELRERLR
jgi:acyl-CoA synthetase (AMP-forming)/AMP-acid ligase II